VPCRGFDCVIAGRCASGGAGRITLPSGAEPASDAAELNLPAGVEINTGTAHNVAVSPDGTSVVFVGMLGGLRRVYLRNLNQSEAVPLPGTETAQSCFFSPDGEAVGFISGDRNLKRVSIANGLVVTLALGVDANGGASWGPDDQVTFGRRGTLWQVPGSGGQENNSRRWRVERAKSLTFGPP
jgi:Tol biopolymer transport system component